MYRVFDLETNTATQFKRKASPWHPDNRVVAYAHKDKDGAIFGVYYPKGDTSYKLEPIPDNVKILVGHNIKFDLLWSWKQESLIKFLKRGGIIWDTQYAYYLLHGQQVFAQMTAMDDIIEEYGGTLKIDAVKDMWQAGINTEDIPQDLLMEYLCGTEWMAQDPAFAKADTDEVLKGDILNTELIFRGQWKQVKEAGMLPAVLERMEGLLATTMMEYNGVYVDKELGLQEAAKLKRRIAEIDHEILQYIPDDKPPEIEFKWSNRYHLSPLMFGGKIKYERWVQHTDEEGNKLYAQKDEVHYLLADGGTIPKEQWDASAEQGEVVSEIEYYKSGKNAGSPKTKNVKVPDTAKPKGAKQEFFWELSGYTTPNTAWKSDTPGLYSVSADVIEELGNRDIPFTVAVAQRAKLNKDLSTYYITEHPKEGFVGMLTLVGEDGIVHHSLNHSLTVTSRLSSSNPNMQNIPRADPEDPVGSEIKKLFRSRFGEDGQVLEADYSQLEVVGKAVLSGDKNLKADLRKGIDFHCKRVSAWKKITYEEALDRCKNDKHPLYAVWKVYRTNAKVFSFQRAYGAGAAKIADYTGMSVEEVEILIAAENKLYPDVEKFDAAVIQTVTQSMWQTGRFERTKEGRAYEVLKGEWISPAGTRYVFTSHEAQDYAKKKGIFTSFMPTEMKNYPTQGECGFFVQGMCGKLARHFISNDNYGGLAFLTNTVHDSVWADAHKSVIKTVAADMKEIMESIPQWAKECFDWDIDVPFPVDVEAGDNLYKKGHING